MFDIISKVVITNIEADPLLNRFGTSESMINLTSAQKHFLSYSLIMATITNKKPHIDTPYTLE